MKIWTEVSEDHPDFTEHLGMNSVFSIVTFAIFGFYCGVISWVLREETSFEGKGWSGIALFIIVYLYTLFWSDRDRYIRPLKIFTISKNIQLFEQRAIIFIVLYGLYALFVIPNHVGMLPPVLIVCLHSFFFGFLCGWKDRILRQNIKKCLQLHRDRSNAPEGDLRRARDTA